MTQARRAELEVVARKLAFDLGHRDIDWKCCLEESTGSIEIIIQVFQQIEREVWSQAVKINEDLILEHDVSSPGISVLAVAANRMRQQREGR